MAGNLDLILAGVAGGGSGNALSWFAPTGTVMPTAADDDFDPDFIDAGWVSEDGLSKTVSVSSTDINGFGSGQPLRTLKTQKKTQFDIAYLETNPTVLEVYYELPLSTIVPDGLGRIDFIEGPLRNQRYAAIFQVKDGPNTMLACCPEVQVTDQQSLAIKNGAGIAYGVSLTAYPGSDGTAVHWFMLLDALAS